MREATRSARRDTFALSCYISADEFETVATLDVATSTMLSAMSASSVVAPAEARTMQTVVGSRWRKSYLRKALFSRVVQRWVAQ